jgi:hypothetical protein
MEEDGSGDLLGARQGDAERARAREEFEFERVVSCGQWWRTKLNLRRREPFDDGHQSTTLRTAPSVAELRGGSILLELLFWCCPQCLEAERQGGGTLAVGQKTEVADAYETFREQMQRKRSSQTVLTTWLCLRPSRVARPVRLADGLIGPARAFAR